MKQTLTSLHDLAALPFDDIIDVRAEAGIATGLPDPDTLRSGPNVFSIPHLGIHVPLDDLDEQN